MGTPPPVLGKISDHPIQNFLLCFLLILMKLGSTPTLWNWKNIWTTSFWNPLRDADIPAPNFLNIKSYPYVLVLSKTEPYHFAFEYACDNGCFDCHVTLHVSVASI